MSIAHLHFYRELQTCLPNLECPSEAEAPETKDSMH